ncbi:MAG: hypothetical protein AAGA60_13725 [Cyanobacteria bacterium P01_E01_bin.42]
MKSAFKIFAAFFAVVVFAFSSQVAFAGGTPSPANFTLDPGNSKIVTLNPDASVFTAQYSNSSPNASASVDIGGGCISPQTSIISASAKDQVFSYNCGSINSVTFSAPTDNPATVTVKVSQG